MTIGAGAALSAAMKFAVVVPVGGTRYTGDWPMEKFPPGLASTLPSTSSTCVLTRLVGRLMGSSGTG